MPKTAGPHESLFDMALTEKTCKGIDVCAHTDGQLIINLIGHSRLDIDERKRCMK